MPSANASNTKDFCGRRLPVAYSLRRPWGIPVKHAGGPPACLAYLWSKRPSTGGNIRGRRRAGLSAGLQPLWLAVRLPQPGERGGGSAHREKLSGRDAEKCGVDR